MRAYLGPVFDWTLSKILNRPPQHPLQQGLHSNLYSLVVTNTRRDPLLVLHGTWPAVQNIASLHEK